MYKINKEKIDKFKTSLGKLAKQHTTNMNIIDEVFNCSHAHNTFDELYNYIIDENFIDDCVGGFNKDRFVKLVRAVKYCDNKHNMNMDRLETVFADSWIMYPTYSALITAIIDLLDDQYETISWWIYESHWGIKWETIYITEANGLEVYLKTEGDLFDYLVGNS